MSAERLVIVDSCSALDIVRSLPRSKVTAQLNPAMALIGLTEAQPETLSFVAPDVVRSELAKNLPAVETELRRHLDNLASGAHDARSATKLFGINSISEISRPDITPIETELLRLLDRLLVAADDPGISDSDKNNAFDRTMSYRAPAKKGTSATHDCFVTEIALRTARLRPHGQTHLLSSNTNDFHDPETSKLDADLAAEFTDAGLHYASSWGALRGQCVDIFST